MEQDESEKDFDKLEDDEEEFEDDEEEDLLSDD
jgi:hypothetical protein